MSTNHFHFPYSFTFFSFLIIEGAGLYDFPPVQRLKLTGDIFGTMMGYLNNVEAGGATAFCKPFKEEIIQPRKGSITFWYSLGNEIHAYVISIFKKFISLLKKILRYQGP